MSYIEELDQWLDSLMEDFYDAPAEGVDALYPGFPFCLPPMVPLSGKQCDVKDYIQTRSSSGSLAGAITALTWIATLSVTFTVLGCIS